jgi:hypothetical protein
MSRYREAPYGFVCPWRDRCPHLEQQSTTWIFAEYQRSIRREHEHSRVRDEMRVELHELEIIVLRPRTIVTHWIHQTAWCPGCRRKVFTTLEGELPFAPIGPTAKAAALYLRHETKLPYRKLQKLMSDLFGLDFVPASSLGFEKRARRQAQPISRSPQESEPEQISPKDSIESWIGSATPPHLPIPRPRHYESDCSPEHVNTRKCSPSSALEVHRQTIMRNEHCVR